MGILFYSPYNSSRFDGIGLTKYYISLSDEIVNVYFKINHKYNRNYAKIGFDSQNKILLLKPVRNNLGGIKLQQNKITKMFFIPARQIYKRFNMKIEKCVYFNNFKWDNDLQAIIIDLAESSSPINFYKETKIEK